MEGFEEKVAIVTGASRGIGEATARHLASLGATVILAARSTRRGGKIADEIADSGGNARVAGCDVGDPDAVSALIADCLETEGQLDLLINNAGTIDPIADIADSDPDQWRAAVDTNLLGVYHGLRFAIPPMIESGGGTIINISSGAAYNPLEGWSAYCATKAAALMLTQSAHTEHASDGIRVIGLSPGTVATDMQWTIRESGVNPVSQLDPSVHIPPEWVAQAVAYLWGDGGDEFLGHDFSLKTNDGRARLGLPAIE